MMNRKAVFLMFILLILKELLFFCYIFNEDF
jgi:hypothetical protein